MNKKESSKSNSKTFFLALIILSALAIFSIVVVVLFSGRDYGSGITSKSTTKAYNDYTFTIPSGLSGDIQENQLIISDKDDKFGAVVVNFESDYSAMVKEKDDTLKQMFSSNPEYDISEASALVKKYNSVELLIFQDIKASGQYIDIVYRKADNTSVLCENVYKYGSKLTESERNRLYYIITSAVKTNTEK